ncbi:MAG: (2Fe-2S)-binding protein [Phycisphaerae bacterium]|nr:(2Fe-2S)-binding protein [Phycisphaerae bacterium]MDZ4829427.1 (2Fe-2S)-binding protein [Phycisphaerae bacterium]
MPAPDDSSSDNGRANAPKANLSRRLFIKTVGSTAAATTITAAGQAAAQVIAQRDDDPVRGPGPIDITLTINGEAKRVKIEPATTLLDTLRVYLNMTGSKEICDRGSCGGCSVLVDGKLTVSCMMLAVDAEGVEVTTIEGLSKGSALDPIQESFVRHDALQCGYCTPGLVVACRALLNKYPKPDLNQIKHELSGNICRCGTYTNVFNAVLEASNQKPIVDQEAR